MANKESSILTNYKLMDYMPVVLEQAMNKLSIDPPYQMIYQISLDFNDNYLNLAPHLQNPYETDTIITQIKEGRLDYPLKKFFQTLLSNYLYKGDDFPLFKEIIIEQLRQINLLDKDTLDKKIDLYHILIEYHFGDIPKIVQSKSFEVNDERLLDFFPQLIEGYERTLLFIQQKYDNTSIIDKIQYYAQVTFPQNEEQLIAYYEKNKSLTESILTVQKIENISIITRMFSEGAPIDISIIVKEALVNWRNEISDIIKQAKEEKRIIKEDSKKKKLNSSDEEIDILYNEVTPRFLQKKNLKAILVEVKDKFSSPQSLKSFARLMKELNSVEMDFLDVIFSDNGDKYYKNFDQNEFEGKAYVYFAVLYKAFIENQVDFLIDIIKNTVENYFLRIAARKLLFIKILQNSKIKNPVGENKIFNGYLNSFERIILNEEEPINIRRENLLFLSKQILTGYPDLSDVFNTQLNDIFIKIYSEILDVNLFNKFAGLKKISEKENCQLELMKDAFKLYEVISRELSNTKNKSREQIRRNEFLLTKMDRKLSSNVSKIKSRSVILNT